MYPNARQRMADDSMGDIRQSIESIESIDRRANSRQSVTSPSRMRASLAFRPSPAPSWGPSPAPPWRPSPAPSKSHTVPALHKKRPAPSPSEKPVAESIPRARNSKGEQFKTACFDWKYSSHAHHHRLICGHDVVTEEIEPCGSNCAQTVTATAENKIDNKPFLCPAPGCKAKVKTLLPKRNATGQFIRAGGRVCKWSHVYGLDRVKDAARIAEKKAEAGQRRRPNAIRKMSESPKPGDKQDKVAPRKKRRLVVQDAEVAALVREPEVLELMRRTGTAVPQHLRNNQSEENEEGLSEEMERVSADATKVGMFEGTTTRAKARENVEAKSGGPICKSAGRKSSGGLPDFTEPEASEDEHNAETEIDAEDMIRSDEYPEQQDDGEIFCVCQTAKPDFLVLCERCEKGFHPGCIGHGNWTIVEYADDMAERDAHFKFDWEDIMENGHTSIFHCPECKDAVAQALEKFQGGAFSQRAAAAEDDQLEDDGIEALMPTQDDMIVQDIIARNLRSKKRKAESDVQVEPRDVEMEDATPALGPVPEESEHPRRRARKTGTAGKKSTTKTDTRRGSTRKGSTGKGSTRKGRRA